MSKKAKSASKERNKKQKQARKNANRAMYQKWAAEGSNQKGTRSHKKKRASQSTKGLHLIAHCGNIACKKCFAHTETRVFAITRNPKSVAA